MARGGVLDLPEARSEAVYHPPRHALVDQISLLLHKGIAPGVVLTWRQQLCLHLAQLLELSARFGDFSLLAALNLIQSLWSPKAGQQMSCTHLLDVCAEPQTHQGLFCILLLCSSAMPLELAGAQVSRQKARPATDL